MEWFGFWIFMAVFVSVDSLVFLRGYDTFFQTHKTELEKELQLLIIEELKLKIEKLKRESMSCNN